jgi:non-specific serine/threonine protein kinase
VGDLDGALASTEEALALAREMGDWHGETVDMMSLGEIARRRGNLADAVAHLREAILLARRVGDPRLCAETLEYLAMTRAGMGSPRESARLLGAAATLREPIGFPQPLVDKLDTEAAVTAARAAIGEEAWTAAFEAGRTLSLEEAIAEALGEVVS